MSRQFPITFAERRLKLCVYTADESWELWLCEGQRRLLLADTVAIDEAIQAWRGGCDAVASKREQVIDQVLCGKIRVPEDGETACPSR